jgi:hypothetical protein
MDWLNTGIQFDFDQITDPGDVRGSCFYTANVSAKTSFLKVNGGFDETFADAALEDIELGLRLERAGMRLVYDEAAVVEHFHPMDLRGSLERMRRLGGAAASLNALVPDWPLPRPSGARHRLKAAVLTTLNMLPGQLPRSLRHATWHFLCHQAFREGCWGVGPRGEHPVHTGRVLARLASRDPSTRISSEVSSPLRADSER